MLLYTLLGHILLLYTSLEAQSEPLLTRSFPNDHASVEAIDPMLHTELYHNPV